jgi:hypothetical protein
VVAPAGRLAIASWSRQPPEGEAAAVKVYVWAADEYGCGHHRAIWPVEALRAQGHDAVAIRPNQRALPVWTDERTGQVGKVGVPTDADVVVFQRMTDARVAATFPVLRANGVAVVVDIDDDLASIHPGNPAFATFHPRGAGDGAEHHSWRTLAQACQAATLVTVSTPALLPIYAAHGRGRVVHNTLAAHYYGLPRRPAGAPVVLGWPGSVHSHPNDPQATRGAVGRLVAEGVRFRVIGDPAGAGAAFGLPDGADPRGRWVALLEWPAAIAARLTVGIAPLAPTRFGRCKSWLKPLELASCGVGWVASDLPEYRRLHQLGCGRLARDGRQWYRELRRLLDSPAARAEAAEAGLAVADQLRLDQHAWRWWEAWADALELERRRGPRRRGLVGPKPSGPDLAALAGLMRQHDTSAAGLISRPRV